MGWRQRQARKPERNIKLISVLQFSVLSFKKKKTVCIYVSVSRQEIGRFPPPARHPRKSQGGVCVMATHTNN